MILMEITMQAIAFWVLAPVMVLGALGMVLSVKAVHSALCLAGVMVCLAVLYAALDGPFLFVVQIIVYTGAVMMLFLFVNMIVGIDTDESPIEVIKNHRVASLALVAGFGVLLVLAVGRQWVGPVVGLDAANAAQGGNVPSVAALVFTDWVLVFEATGALLITAALAAMVLSHSERIKPKVGQKALAAIKTRAYAEQGTHPGPRPNPGVYALTNAVQAPALLPDGSVAEASLSPTLAARGVVVDVNELRQPTVDTFRTMIESQPDSDRARGLISEFDRQSEVENYGALDSQAGPEEVQR